MNNDRENNGHFKPGHSIRGGRKKGSLSLSDEFRKLLQQKDDKGKKFIETLARQMFAEMLKGNDKYAIELWRHLDGMPKQQIDVESENGINININFTDADDER